MSMAPARTGPSTRWLQLVLGIICMASVANLQYGWTLFVLPIQHQWGWSKAEIQIAFSIFILLETWLTPDAETRIRRRMRYVRADPDIRDGLTRQTREMATRFGDMLAARMGRDGNDLAVRLSTAAVIWPILTQPLA